VANQPTLNLPVAAESVIASLSAYGSGIGLHRMHYLCRHLLHSDWGKRVKTIHVVGSNGKGSTASMLAAMLGELGISHGLFISPHVLDIRERISVNGQYVSLEEMQELEARFEALRQLYARQCPGDEFGAFEALTYMALQHFFEQQVEVLVLEAGIGGRYDATRIMQGDFVAFTSIDLEHSALLGPTEELIAYDKMDIAPAGATVVMGELEPGLHSRLEVYARLRQVQLLPIASYTQASGLHMEHDRMHFNFCVDALEFEHISTPMLGHKQQQNARLATLLLKRWLHTHHPEVPASELQRACSAALSKLHIQGRFQQISCHPPIYADVAHTPKAIRHLAETFHQIKTGKTLVLMGVSGGKDVQAFIDELLGIADALILTRSWHRGKSLKAVPLDTTVPILGYEPIEAAVDAALQHAREHNMCVLITGSVFVVAEAWHYLNGQDPRKLHFL